MCDGGLQTHPEEAGVLGDTALQYVEGKEDFTQEHNLFTKRFQSCYAEESMEIRHFFVEPDDAGFGEN